jgi:MFS family permease
MAAYLPAWCWWQSQAQRSGCFVLSRCRSGRLAAVLFRHWPWPDWWPVAMSAAAGRLRANVFLLGLANGAFAVAAIGSMMALAGAAGPRKEGIRMGLWGAAQAIAFGLGGFLGTVAVDVMRLLTGSPLQAYILVFATEAILFIWSAKLAAGIIGARCPVAGQSDATARQTPTTETAA